MRLSEVELMKLSDIVDLSVYPVADIMPMLPKTAGYQEGGGRKQTTISLAELADSINDHGLQDPIVLFINSAEELVLLDGRNRRAACQLAKIEEVPVRYFIGTEEEADDFVLNAGLDRRDLDANARAMSAAKFEYNCPEAFARLVDQARANQGVRNDLATNLERGSEESQRVAHILAKRFRVSVGYIYDARRILREERAALVAAEKAAEEAALQEAIAEAKKAEAEAARATGDHEVAQEAIREANQASNNAANRREVAAVKAVEASSLANKAENVLNGKSKLREPKKEQKSESDDPIKVLRTRINSSVTNLKQAIEELSKVSDGGEDDWNFVARKLSDLLEHAELTFGVEVG